MTSETSRANAMVSAVGTRGRMFASTLPLPKPIQFCFPRLRNRCDKVVTHSRSRLERLSLAMGHLERAAVTAGTTDGRANWCVAILMYQSAVDGLGVPGARSFWLAVRHHIVHDLDIGKFSDQEFAEVVAKAKSSFGASWTQDEDGSFAAPRTWKDAVPILDFRQSPTDFAINELSIDISGARCYVALARVRQFQADFARWERMMAEITARLWCDWSLEQCEAWVKLSPEMRIYGRHGRLKVPVPEGLQSACEAFVELTDTNDHLVRDWLVDECATWLGAQDQFLRLRISRPARHWSPTCDQHHQKARWRRNTLMCEALDLEGDLCGEIALCPYRTPPTVKKFVNPFLEKNARLD